jgi:hypothetical protein
LASNRQYEISWSNLYTLARNLIFWSPLHIMWIPNAILNLIYVLCFLPVLCILFASTMHKNFESILLSLRLLHLNPFSWSQQYVQNEYCVCWE